nr:sensor histidine kinase [Vibrio stylophorae]
MLALRGHKHAQQVWQPTLTWLEQQMPGYQFVLHTYDFDQLEDAFLHDWLDFILTSPGQMTHLAAQYPVTRLATQKSAHSEIPNRSIASVALVRNDSSLDNFEDLGTARIAAVSNKAFGGYLAFHHEIEKMGQFGDDFFSRITFTGPPTDQLVFDVLDHRFDMVIVPACTLESLVAEGKVKFNELRVLNLQPSKTSKCKVSTALYPSWSFAMTNRPGIEIGQKVAQALMAMPSDHPAATIAQNRGWMMPSSHVNIDKVFRDLDMHPLQKPFAQVFATWVKEHRLYVCCAMALLVFSVLYHLWLHWRFKRSRDHLKKTLNDLRRKSSMLEHAQRVAIVGELGSSLAHEINQPLAAIQNYSQGAKIRMERGVSSQEMLPVIDKIQHQVTAASNIIQRLRDLIHKKPVEKNWCDLVKLTEETIKLVDYEFQRAGVQLGTFYSGEPRPIFADAVGLQQVILNVVKNGKDACLSHQMPPSPLFVDVHVIFFDHEVLIEVTDNGIGLVQDHLPLDHAFYSTKENGLGLGLAICRDVVEGHRGTIQLRTIEPTGCQVTVVLPYLHGDIDA